MARKIEIDFGKEEALLSFDERKGEFMILLKGGEERKGNNLVAHSSNDDAAR